MTLRDPEEYARMKKAAWSFLCWPLGLVFCIVGFCVMKQGADANDYPAAAWGLLGMMMFFVQICWSGVVMSKKITAGDLAICTCCGVGVATSLLAALAPLSERGAFIMFLLTFLTVLCSRWIAEGAERLFGNGNRA